MCDLKSGCERVQLDRTETRTEREWTARIAAEFKKIGMPPHMLGHVYLCDAVVLSILLPKCMRQKMNQIYVVIGERFGTTPARVERNIRTVIKATWERGAGPGGPCWDVWRELSEQQPYQFGICGPYALESPAAIGEKAPAVGPGLFHGKA